MKTSKSLFYVGITIFTLPLLFIILFYFVSKNTDSKIEKKVKKEIHRDTIRVKVYDTIVIQKIKYIKKPKPNTSDSTSD